MFGLCVSSSGLGDWGPACPCSAGLVLEARYRCWIVCIWAVLFPCGRLLGREWLIRIGPVPDRFQTSVACRICGVHVTVSCQICGVMSDLRSVMSDLRSVISDMHLS